MDVDRKLIARRGDTGDRYKRRGYRVCNYTNIEQCIPPPPKIGEVDENVESTANII